MTETTESLEAPTAADAPRTGRGRSRTKGEGLSGMVLTDLKAGEIDILERFMF